MVNKEYLENKKAELIAELEKINNGEIYGDIQEKVDSFKAEKMAALEEEVAEYEKSLRENVEKEYDKTKYEHYIELCDELLKAFDEEEIVEEKPQVENVEEIVEEPIVEEPQVEEKVEESIVEKENEVVDEPQKVDQRPGFMFLNKH